MQENYKEQIAAILAEDWAAFASLIGYSGVAEGHKIRSFLDCWGNTGHHARSLFAYLPNCELDPLDIDDDDWADTEAFRHYDRVFGRRRIRLPFLSPDPRTYVLFSREQLEECARRQRAARAQPFATPGAK